eukprot:2736024-Alexandrium_andersonii.AAC.1
MEIDEDGNIRDLSPRSVDTTGRGTDARAGNAVRNPEGEWILPSRGPTATRDQVLVYYGYTERDL